MARNILDALVGIIGMDYPTAEDAVERLDRAGWEIVDRLIERRPGHYEDVRRPTCVCGHRFRNHGIGDVCLCDCPCLQYTPINLAENLDRCVGCGAYADEPHPCVGT